MKISFHPAKSLTPDRERGLRVPYAPVQRAMARWRWILILLLVSAPLLVIVGQLLVSMVFVSAPGLLVLERVPLNAAMPATVDTLRVAPGDRLEPGDVVVALRSADLDQRELVLRAEAVARRVTDSLPNGEAVLRELQTQVQLATKVVDYQAGNLKGVRFLFDQGAATQADLRLAETQLHQAEMALAQARAGWAARQSELARQDAGDRENRTRLQLIAAELAAIAAERERLTSTSPVRGLVVEVIARPGQAVGQGDPLAVLGNLESVTVSGYLEAKHIRYARPGQPATVHFENGLRLAAVVRDKPELATRIPEPITPALSGREYTLLLTLDLVDPLPPGDRVDHLPVTVHFPFSF